MTIFQVIVRGRKPKKMIEACKDTGVEVFYQQALGGGLNITAEGYLEDIMQFQDRLVSAAKKSGNEIVDLASLDR